MNINVNFIHPPSIYDFRKRDMDPGPVSDVVPSTPIFEMYPIGFVSMLNYLVSNGYDARISNIAVMMLHSDRFDPARYLKDINADIYGIDLHWLPHTHGAINLAKIVKKLHPNSYVVMGGYSSTYFRKEIMKNYDFIDFVMSGDFQEYGIMKLAEAVEGSKRFETVPGLLYRENGMIKENPRYDFKKGLDNVFFNYEVLLKNAIKYHDVRAHLPYADWIKNPEGFTMIERGCQLNCGFCGGSNFSYRNNFMLDYSFRDPCKVAEEIKLSQQILGSPVFLNGDLNLAGPLYYEKLFKCVKENGIDVPLLTEYFKPFGEDYVKALSRAFPDFSAEISPETQDEKVRSWNKGGYKNSDMEKSIDLTKKYGGKKFDVYFSIGLSHQTRDEVMKSADYAGYLIKKYNGNGMKLSAFESPIAPFVDPGSLWYEKSETYGINVYARSLQEIYNVLDKGRTWFDFLDYDTQWMKKEDIVNATYDADIKILRYRYEINDIPKELMENIIKNITEYREGGNYCKNKKMDKHLAYLNKDIEWSRKHRPTLTSLLILLYKSYDSVISGMSV
ncbi:MAG: TIGR04190 family B12-binding domain/radical SAM domain protein [Thermoplasmata archaeon]